MKNNRNASSGKTNGGNNPNARKTANPLNNWAKGRAQTRRLLESTALNGMILYGVFVFFLRSGRISGDNIKLSFGVIGLYIASVYLRFLLNHIKGNHSLDLVDKGLVLLGPMIVAVYLLGILGVILGA